MAATQHTILQAGQLQEHGLNISVFRTLAEQEGPLAVLRLMDPDGAVHELELTTGQFLDVPGVGRITLLAVQPSTREQRGWVRIAHETSDAGDATDVDDH